MKIKIEIDCEDFNELNCHLESIKEQIKLNEDKINEMLDDEHLYWEKRTITLQDSNCYGDHIIKVRI